MQRPSQGMVDFVDARARRRAMGWVLAASGVVGLVALFTWANPGACVQLAAQLCGDDADCTTALEASGAEHCELGLTVVEEIDGMSGPRAQQLSGSEAEPRAQLRARVRGLLSAQRWPRLALQGPESFARAIAAQ